MDLVEMSVTASEYRDLDRRWAQRLAVEKAALQTEIARLRRELTAPAPEPAVDWEARAKATEDRIARALDVHDKWHYDVATCRRGYSNAAICRAADILRGES